jgi:hypothetical protein
MTRQLNYPGILTFSKTFANVIIDGGGGGENSPRALILSNLAERERIIYRWQAHSYI